MSAVTYRDGVATITTPTSETKIDVALTAGLVLAGDVGDIVRASPLDLVALSAGFAHLERENLALRDELAAARAGTIGREHAEAMQGARKVIAELSNAVGGFLAVYDDGDAPDDVNLRDKAGAAETWLLRDANASVERAKVLKGGAA